jgi:hypothetical protein
MIKLTLLAVITFLSVSSYSQTVVTTNAQGNYVAVNTPKVKEADKDTGKTFTDSKGVVYKVYTTSTGRLYILRKSKRTAKEYKQYLDVKS